MSVSLTAVGDERSGEPAAPDAGDREAATLLQVNPMVGFLGLKAEELGLGRAIRPPTLFVLRLDWTSTLFVLRLLQVFPAKGFLGARTGMAAAAAAETTGLAPAKEVMEKKVELMKEVCYNLSVFSHLCWCFAWFSPSFLFLFFELGW